MPSELHAICINRGQYHQIAPDRGVRDPPGCLARPRLAVRDRVVVRGGVEPPTSRFSVERSYQLSYLTMPPEGDEAELTGFEPATFTLTG